MDTIIIFLVIALFVGEGLFVWWLANRRRRVRQETATVVSAPAVSKLSSQLVLARGWRIVRSLLLISIVPLIMIFFFGFFIKTTSEYACALRTAQQSSQVVEVTGEPVMPGLFAWMPYFESSGGLVQGLFFTTLSGPSGRGMLRAEFYRAPIGATLYVTFDAGGEKLVIYDGEYPCP